MAHLGIKLGRHSVQAALWSENAGRPVEAHLPGLEVESASWHPVLGRDAAGRLSWGEDLWSHLHQVAPQETSLPEALTGEASAEAQGLLREILWPEVRRLAEKELRGGERHHLGVVVTLPPAPGLEQALQASLPPDLELVAVEGVGAGLLAAARAHLGEALSGRVLTAHFGGAEAQLCLWEVEPGADRLSLRALADRRVPELGLEAVLGRVAALLTGEWGLISLEEPGSPAERDLRDRLLRHLRRRLGESRSTWEVAWQYDPPVDLRHLARWAHPGPAPLPAEGIRQVLEAAAERLRREVEALESTGGTFPVLVSGAGAAPEYFGPVLVRLFGRRRLPFLAQSASLPARGAAALARWTALESPVRVEITRKSAGPAPQEAPRPEEAAPAPPATSAASSGPGLGLALATDGLSAAWAAAGALTAEVVPLQGRRVVPACVAIDRRDPAVRRWGALAEGLAAEPERYALIRALPGHVGTGTQFVVTGPGGRVSLGPEELLRSMLEEAAREAADRAHRLGQAPETVVACWPPEWDPAPRAAAESVLENRLSLPAREADPAVAAWLSSLPARDAEEALVLLVSGPGLYGAHLRRDPAAWGGWQVAGRSVESGFGGEFAAEVLSRFLTDELNGRFARSYRYTDLLKARPGTEARLLGEGLRREGEELAERLVREPAATQRMELRLPGGGTALFDASVTREQWESWAGRRVREAVARVLEGIGAITAAGEAPARRGLLLAGSGASLPLFPRAVETLGFSVTPHPQPELASALGAALLAGEWAGRRAQAPALDLLVLGDAPAAAVLLAAAAERGLTAERVDPEGLARVAVVLVGGGADALPGQEVERALRKGLPVLPLRLDAPPPAATTRAGASLDILSAAMREQVDRLLDRAQRLLDCQGK